jgi:serine/threonine-protein kinase
MSPAHAFDLDSSLALTSSGSVSLRAEEVRDEITDAGWERSLIDQRLAGQYQVVREIGRGGMGVVFLARDIALHRLVALKVLRREFAESEEHRERFRREARTTARLSHPGIVPVHTFGEDGALVYIVMKFVNGESLAERLRRVGTLPTGEARAVLVALARALESAHAEGVVHRDLKAENILLERGTGRAMLTDFGVALVRSLDPVRAESARAFGTPHYMSPEQAAGELDLDGRSDLYALGVLAHVMLAGHPPFDAPTFEALAAKHVTEPAPELRTVAPDVVPALGEVVDRCLVKDREQRWRSARELAEALERARPRRRWRLRTPQPTPSLGWPRIAADLALFVGALSAVLRGGKLW